MWRAEARRYKERRSHDLVRLTAWRAEARRNKVIDSRFADL
jgi:hypothetical protein